MLEKRKGTFEKVKIENDDKSSVELSEKFSVYIDPNDGYYVLFEYPDTPANSAENAEKNADNITQKKA
jgi:hypothetical protein